MKKKHINLKYYHEYFNTNKKGSFDQYLKVVKNKNISPRLKKLKKSILIKSPYIKKTPKVSPSKSA